MSAIAKGPSPRGLFIAIEGIDGCGKTTQAARLAAWLERTGRAVVRTFEPGGWSGGAALRSVILDGPDLPPEAELLLFLADRAAHLAEVVRPALAGGRAVVCERYVASTWAYQAGGRGLDPELVRGLVDRCGFPDPDMTILLEISPDVAAARLRGRGRHDRIEAGGAAFMARVADAYADWARRGAVGIIRVDAEGTEEDVAARVQRAVEEKAGASL